MSHEAAQPSSVEPASHLVVYPEQFKIDVELNREVFLELKLTNTSSSLATFKVKTTARDRYQLRPTQDYIRPHETKVCSILTKMKEYPDFTNPKAVKDKFLVQSTIIDQEVPDLTKFWKDLETHHNPKAMQFMYSETKIKCKLQVPAKVRAQDAAKRGQAEEEAASAALATPARVSEARQAQRTPDTHDDATRSRQPIEAASVPPPSSAAAVSQSLPRAAPVESAAAAPAVAAPVAIPADLQQPSSSGTDSEKQRYAELMQFVVSTTQQLESERQEKEAAETRVISLADRVKSAELRASKAEQALAASKEEVSKLVASLAAVKRAAAAAVTDAQSESDAAVVEAARRRKLAESPSPLAATPPIRSNALADKSQPPALQIWQIALMALVCFVLGRIFG